MSTSAVWETGANNPSIGQWGRRRHAFWCNHRFECTWTFAPTATDGQLSSVRFRRTLVRRQSGVSLVDREPSHLLVARSAATVAGFIAFGGSRDDGAPDDRAEVWAIYVRPVFWCTGVGRQLWLAAWQQMQTEGYTTASLWVIADNARAIRFYERAGFVAEGGFG